MDQMIMFYNTGSAAAMKVKTKDYSDA